MAKQKYSIDEILLVIFEGVNYGIISQFIGDIVVLIYFGNDQTISEEVEILTVPSYVAAAITGAVTGFGSLYYDAYITNIIGLVTYSYVFNLISDKLGDSEFDIDVEQMITDIGAIVILLTIFDPSALESYYNFKEGKTSKNENSLFQSLLISIITTVYFSYESEIELKKNQALADS